MKRIADSSLGKHLEPVRLSRADLEHIDRLIRQVAPSLAYQHDDYEFESIEELAAQCSPVIDRLVVKASDPYISLEFGRRSVWLFTSSKNLAARGVYADLREFLEERATWSFTLRKTALENLSSLGLVVGTFGLIEKQFLLAGMAIAIAPITLGVSLFGTSRSQIALSNQQQGFWGRNRDNLIAGIISSALVSLAIAIIQLAFS